MKSLSFETSDTDLCDLLNELFHMNKIFFWKKIKIAEVISWEVPYDTFLYFIYFELNLTNFSNSDLVKFYQIFDLSHN